ncbi:uncharacterized protein LOC114287492 isoform X4 [Camellia sinensis]|uniref:uncharacterized protein LOC114287492 isoform X4 n=1 Tax=Camellia sinensis TaxID=4442 RepID=UPI001036F2A3|nr:uncharacterized protein LOC114287492 isoform X4 [Camellia sinensis]
MRRMVVMRLKCLWRLRRRMRTIRSSMMPPMIAKRCMLNNQIIKSSCCSQCKEYNFFIIIKGHYVPQLAEQILHNNKNAPKDDYINLKGFIRRAFFGMGNSSLSEVCHTPKPPLVVWCRDGQ